METKQKATKVSKEDIELANEISRVTAIKELVTQFQDLMSAEFLHLVLIAEAGNAVRTYKEILDARDCLLESAATLQVQLLTVIGEIDSEDALELSDPNKTGIEGTMDSAIQETDTKFEAN